MQEFLENVRKRVKQCYIEPFDLGAYETSSVKRWEIEVGTKGDVVFKKKKRCIICSGELEKHKKFSQRLWNIFKNKQTINTNKEG